MPNAPAAAIAADGTLLARFEKGDGQETRVSLREFRGHNFLDIRLHFRNDEGEWCATRKGATVRVEDLTAFAEAIAKAQRLVRGHK